MRKFKGKPLKTGYQEAAIIEYKGREWRLSYKVSTERAWVGVMLSKMGKAEAGKANYDLAYNPASGRWARSAAFEALEKEIGLYEEVTAVINDLQDEFDSTGYQGWLADRPFAAIEGGKVTATGRVRRSQGTKIWPIVRDADGTWIEDSPIDTATTHVILFDNGHDFAEWKASQCAQ